MSEERDKAAEAKSADWPWARDEARVAFKAGWDQGEQRLKDEHFKWCPHFYHTYQKVAEERDALKAEVGRLREVSKSLNRDVNKHFEQSCKNLKGRDRWRAQAENLAGFLKLVIPSAWTPNGCRDLVKDALAEFDSLKKELGE